MVRPILVLSLIHICYIRNTTNVANSEVAEIAAAGNPIKIDGNGPQVLIMHTHATESFEKYDLGWYDRAVPTRSTDDTINTVAIGDELSLIHIYQAGRGRPLPGPTRCWQKAGSPAPPRGPRFYY